MSSTQVTVFSLTQSVSRVIFPDSSMLDCMTFRLPLCVVHETWTLHSNQGDAFYQIHCFLFCKGILRWTFSKKLTEIKTYRPELQACSHKTKLLSFFPAFLFKLFWVYPMISSKFYNFCTLEISFLQQVPTSMARSIDWFKLSVSVKLYVNLCVIVHICFIGLVGELRLCFS